MSPEYLIAYLLPVHMSCALLSLLLFIWRGSMMWSGAPLTKRLWRRTLPDSVDTLLLSSGVLMAYLMEISPLDSHWLAAKITALIVYIVLGAIALTYGRKTRLKRYSFIAALFVFGYILAVARTMSATPWT